MDYNSNRVKLLLPEYGRNVQMMVDFAMKIEDRDERNKAAKTIISYGLLNRGPFVGVSYKSNGPVLKEWLVHMLSASIHSAKQV